MPQGARFGAAIDGADAVIRVNMAPTRTFEKYVGTRTTFDVVGPARIFFAARHAPSTSMLLLAPAILAAAARRAKVPLP